MKSWYDGPSTNRQLKVLNFFNVLPPKDLTKGLASKLIFKVFKGQHNREDWEKYTYFTQDTTQDSAD